MKTVCLTTLPGARNLEAASVQDPDAFIPGTGVWSGAQDYTAIMDSFSVGLVLAIMSGTLPHDIVGKDVRRPAAFLANASRTFLGALGVDLVLALLRLL